LALQFLSVALETMVSPAHAELDLVAINMLCKPQLPPRNKLEFQRRGSSGIDCGAFGGGGASAETQRTEKIALMRGE
ncbi:hypothetical protein P692DRAFT_201795001, partial [Suillus brevipes Sb2]